MSQSLPARSRCNSAVAFSTSRIFLCVGTLPLGIGSAADLDPLSVRATIMRPLEDQSCPMALLEVVDSELQLTALHLLANSFDGPGYEFSEIFSVEIGLGGGRRRQRRGCVPLTASKVAHRLRLMPPGAAICNPTALFLNNFPHLQSFRNR